MTERAAGERVDSAGGAVVRLSIVAILLAVGLAFLYLAIRLVLGETVAAAIIAALGIGYGALAFFSDTDQDDPKLRRALVALFRPGWRSYSAIGFVWIAAVLVAAIPMARGEFIINIVDEFGRPVESAEVWVDFGSGERAFMNEKGVARASYFIPLVSGSARVRVENAGMTTTVDRKAGDGGRFDPLQVAVWSGNPVLRTTHVTFEGMAIDSVLKGRLPPDLARRFPNVSMVLPNEVFDTAKEFVATYAVTEDPAVQYLEDQVRQGQRIGRARMRWYIAGQDPGFERVPNVRAVRPIYASAVMDMSDDILGCPTGEPLRPGFQLRINSGDDFYLGTPAKPVGSASALLNEGASSGRGEDGSFSILVERALDRGDLTMMLRRSSSIGELDTNEPELRSLLRLLVNRNAPRGLLKGWARLSRFYEECAGVETEVAVEFQIPAPKLRATLLENATQRPIRIDRVVQVLAQRSGFGRRDGPATRVERLAGNGAYYELQPGETIIVPREFTIQSMASDEKISSADQSDVGRPVVMFEILPTLPYYEDMPPVPQEQDFAMRPRRISISVDRLILPNDEASDYFDEDEESPEDRGYGVMGLPAGAENLIGPSLVALDYVVGGVRMRARSDTRTRIAMIGDTEAGSCPFVFVSYRGNSRPINRGQIISDQIGASAQGPDRMLIGRDFERIEIRELERERSHLDMARLLVPSRGGVREYRALQPLLAVKDGRYLVLERGDSIALEFGYRPAPGDGPATLEVDGYYVPLTLTQR